VLGKRRDDGVRYGAVLIVNGENTIFRQKDRSPFAHKWVIGPGVAKVRIRGYQTAGGRAEAFRVLSTPESRKRAVNYGDEAGRSRWSSSGRRRRGPVPAAGPPRRRPRRARPKPSPPSPGARTRVGAGDAAVERDALKLQLRDRPDRAQLRGVIDGGDAFRSGVHEVECRFLEEPVMAATVNITSPDSHRTKGFGDARTQEIAPRCASGNGGNRP